MKKNAIIIGYSGHSYVVLDTLLSNKFHVLGYCEKEKKASNPYNLEYLGEENDPELNSLFETSHIFIGIGDNKARAEIFNSFFKKNITCPFVIHNSANVSPLAQINLGTVVLPGAIINSCAQLGKAIICNSSSVIEHECKIEDYCHIAPGAVLAGNVSVGAYSFIGANSVIKQGVRIGSNVIIGAGSVVTNDVESGAVVYGNPARKRK